MYISAILHYFYNITYCFILNTLFKNRNQISLKILKIIIIRKSVLNDPCQIINDLDV